MKFAGLNVLVVDDEAAVKASIKMVLKKSGHSVDMLHDGDDALSKLKESPSHYHVLITDHFMCKVSGLELVERLKPMPFKGRIIVVSGYLTVELEASFRALGVETIIRKPFELGELRKAVEEVGC